MTVTVIDPNEAPDWLKIQVYEAEIKVLMEKIYVPGEWYCPKCRFSLIQKKLNALDGTVTARDEPGDKCPNCSSPLWRVSERDLRKNLQRDLERIWDEKNRIAKCMADVHLLADHLRCAVLQPPMPSQSVILSQIECILKKITET
jgi:uncharacterized protein with PIN domain